VEPSPCTTAKSRTLEHRRLLALAQHQGTSRWPAANNRYLPTHLSGVGLRVRDADHGRNPREGAKRRGWGSPGCTNHSMTHMDFTPRGVEVPRRRCSQTTEPLPRATLRLLVVEITKKNTRNKWRTTGQHVLSIGAGGNEFRRKRLSRDGAPLRFWP